MPVRETLLSVRGAAPVRRGFPGAEKPAQKRALGARLLQRRRARHWTQPELARRTGLRALRISKLENGHSTPSLPELLRLAEALDAGLDELVRGAPPQGSLLLPLQELEELASPEECAVLGKLLRILLAGFRATRPRAEDEEGRHDDHR